MLQIKPIKKALVATDSTSAQRLCSPNYDEFQSDREIHQFIQNQPDSVLQITMPHCAVQDEASILKDGSPEALKLARQNIEKLKSSDLVRVAEDSLFIYEIADKDRPGTRQIGLGGMSQISQIRTPETPEGVIIRNEGIREQKAQGRADLIRSTDAIIGMVNNAVDDASGAFLQCLKEAADRRECDYSAIDEDGNAHRIWLVSDSEEIKQLTDTLSREPHAYVADGNHRSAAAAMLKTGGFLNVIFPAHTMGIAPYNRLVKAPDLVVEEFLGQLRQCFTVEALDQDGAYQPSKIHEIGLYVGKKWHRLTPNSGTFDPDNAAEDIDSDIVQRHIFNSILGIEDPRDKRLNFVGGNRDAAYLQSRVDAGEYELAITLAPVTIEQFIAVCQQNRMMPPKSTWFHPKIKSGLVIALLG